MPYKTFKNKDLPKSGTRHRPRSGPGSGHKPHDPKPQTNKHKKRKTCPVLSSEKTTSLRTKIRNELTEILTNLGLSKPKIEELFNLFRKKRSVTRKNIEEFLSRHTEQTDPNTWTKVFYDSNHTVMGVHCSATKERVQKQMIGLMVYMSFELLHTKRVIIGGDFNHRLVVKNSNGTMSIAVLDKEIGKDKVIFEIEIPPSLSDRFDFEYILGPVEEKIRFVTGQLLKCGVGATGQPFGCLVVSKKGSKPECKMTPFTFCNNSLEIATTRNPMSYIPGYGSIDHQIVTIEIDDKLYIFANLHGEKGSDGSTSQKSCLYNILEYGDLSLVPKLIEWMNEHKYQLPKDFLKILQDTYCEPNEKKKTLRQIGNVPDFLVEYPIPLFLKFLEYCKKNQKLSNEMISFFESDIETHQATCEIELNVLEIIGKFYKYFGDLIDQECCPFLELMTNAFNDAYSCKDNATCTTKGMADAITGLISSLIGDKKECFVILAEIDEQVTRSMGFGNDQFSKRYDKGAEDGTVCGSMVKTESGDVLVLCPDELYLVYDVSFPFRADGQCQIIFKLQMVKSGTKPTDKLLHPKEYHVIKYTGGVVHECLTILDFVPNGFTFDRNSVLSPASSEVLTGDYIGQIHRIARNWNDRPFNRSDLYWVK